MSAVSDQDALLRDLAAAVLSSPKYSDLCLDVVRNVGARELKARGDLKDAIKATKNKLHQVGASYLPRRTAYEAWLAELSQAKRSGGEQALRSVCARVMRHHASTRERLPILDQFYETTLHDIAPVRSVLDVACGFNPLAIPWMPLAPEATYYAYDMYVGLASFVRGFLELMERPGRAVACDVVQCVPTEEVELAFLLKALPCLERLDKAVGTRLMEGIRARHLLVSFPVRSLGGRAKGMETTYRARFRELVRGKRWAVQSFLMETELAFLVSK